MTNAVTLRMEEWHRYDIDSDQQVVRLLGITGVGTFTAEFGVGSSQELREKRKSFREYVLECMDKGIAPHEVSMEEEDA